MKSSFKGQRPQSLLKSRPLRAGSSRSSGRPWRSASPPEAHLHKSRWKRLRAGDLGHFWRRYKGPSSTVWVSLHGRSIGRVWRAAARPTARICARPVDRRSRWRCGWRFQRQSDWMYRVVATRSRHRQWKVSQPMARSRVRCRISTNRRSVRTSIPRRADPPRRDVRRLLVRGSRHGACAIDRLRRRKVGNTRPRGVRFAVAPGDDAFARPSARQCPIGDRPTARKNADFDLFRRPRQMQSRIVLQHSLMS